MRDLPIAGQEQYRIRRHGRPANRTECGGFGGASLGATYALSVLGYMGMGAAA